MQLARMERSGMGFADSIILLEVMLVTDWQYFFLVFLSF